MVTKGIVTEIINKYQVRVRIPIYNKSEESPTATPNEELSIGPVCTLPGVAPNFNIGDVVIVAFEQDIYTDPVILGKLYLNDIHNTYSDVHAGELKVTSKATLPLRTTIGEVTSDDISALKNVHGNIQNQLDLLEDKSNKISSNFVVSTYQQSNISAPDYLVIPNSDTSDTNYSNLLDKYDNISNSSNGATLTKVDSGYTDESNNKLYYYEITPTVYNKSLDVSVSGGTMKQGRYTYYGSGTENTILISTGHHGNERQSIESVYSITRFIMESEESLAIYLRNNVHFVIVPCVNPIGYNSNTRTSYNDIDTNRDFPAGGNSTYYQTVSSQFLASLINTWSQAFFGNGVVYLDCHDFTGLDGTYANNNLMGFVNNFKLRKSISSAMMKAYNLTDKFGLLKTNPLRLQSIAENGTSAKYAFEKGILYSATVENRLNLTDSKYSSQSKDVSWTYLINIIANALPLIVGEVAPFNGKITKLSDINASTSDTILQVANKLPRFCSLTFQVSSSTEGSTVLAQSLPTYNSGIFKTSLITIDKGAAAGSYASILVKDVSTSTSTPIYSSHVLYDGSAVSAWELLSTSTQGVVDVRMNSTSIVSNQVADIPLASTSSVGVVSTEAQTFAGAKTFSKTVTVSDTTANGAGLNLRFTDKSNNSYAAMWAALSNYGGRLSFREMSGNASGVTAYGEVYRLPNPDAGRTANATYDILTTKEAVTVAQGGTGANTVTGAVNNLQTWSLGPGTAIPNGSDLNSYTTIGNYTCGATADAKTVLHNPYSDAASTSMAAFILKVCWATGTTSTYLKQELKIYNTTQVWQRYSTNSGSSWSDWTVLLKKAKATAEGSTSIPVYITAEGNPAAISAAIPISLGGTSKTTVTDAINNFLQNGCSAGTSDPVDGDTYIASYADGKNSTGTGTNTFHRRPVEKLWNYINGKASSVYAAKSHTHNYAGSSSAGGAATNVNLTDTTGSGTSYYVPFATGYSGSQTLRANDHFYFYDTASESWINSGKSGRKGGVTLWNGSYYNNLAPNASLTANRTITFPNATGTVSLEGHTHSYLPLSGGTMTGTIYYGATDMNRAILAFSSTYPKYGIWYHDASTDTMRFSASGNADTDAGADLCINGNGAGTVTIRGKTIYHSGNITYGQTVPSNSTGSNGDIFFKY